MTADQDSTILHATTVALGARAVVITGASGTGKSALGLELISRGAVLVADDRTRIDCRSGALIASSPPAIRGMIEARGVGLLTADTVAQAMVVLAVDLDTPETERLPPMRETRILRQSVALLHRVEHAHFPAAIVQYLKGGRRA